MPSLEAAEPDPTQASAPESTDTEMYQALERKLLISSDYQAGLVRNAAQALDEVAGGDVRSVQFREPDEEEEEVPRTLGTRDKNRGRSILKKMTANTATNATPRQPHTPGDVPSGVGSPLARHPSNREPWGGDLRLTPGYQALMKKFQDHAQKTYDWYTKLKQSQSCSQRPSSRKRGHQAPPKPPTDTPTQSPLQKSGCLQSVVSVVKREQPKDRGAPRDPADDDIPIRQCSNGTFESAPYHLCGSPEVIAEQFVLYCTDRFGREEFKDEVEDFGNVFGHQTAFVARFCMVTAVYFEVAWVRGYRWVFPNIPPEMEKMTSRRGAILPASPKESVRRTGVDVSERCLRRWHYFLALMQFWKDKMTPFQYGGIVRYDSKVMLYVMFRLKAILKSVDFQFHHYAVKNTTTWGEYARRNLTGDQVTADRKAHQKTQDELTHMKNWMQHRYKDEADLELEVLR